MEHPDTENHTLTTRAPNRRLTEEDWLACMEDFKRGLSDAACGLKWGVTAGAVARQRFNRGVRREDYAVQRKPRLVLRQAQHEASGEDSAEVQNSLILTPDWIRGKGEADPASIVRALMKHGLTLAAEGRYEEALGVARLTRSQALGYRALGGFGSEAPGAGLPKTPSLHHGQRTPEGE